LCGSPTDILKVGLAAWPTLRLGGVCLCGPSITAGSTGGGLLGCENVEFSISSYVGSNAALTLVFGGCTVTVEGLELGTTCRSFSGSSGGSSGSGAADEFAPNGPKGPNASSIASSCVVCVALRRGVRDDRAIGAFTGSEGVGTEDSVLGVGLGVGSAIQE